MIPPDQEIYEVEQRIALRRSQVKRHAREAGQRAMQKLSSPAALGAAALLGFLAAARFTRREKKPQHPERRKSDHTKAAKATGLAGLLTTAAMWYIRAQYGSPVQAAQSLLQKFQKRNAPTPRKAGTSPRPDIVHP